MKTSPESDLSSLEYSKKQKQWDNEINRLEKMVDLLGLPIDTNIREAVAAFNINGFPTYMSCEGHVEERFGSMIKISPYVGFGTPEPDIRFEGQEEIKRKIGEKYGVKPETVGLHIETGNKEADREYWDYIQNELIPETSEFTKVRDTNEKLAREMQILLDEFYSTRKTFKKLKIDVIGPASHASVSCDLDVASMSESELDKYTRELKEEQHEMNEFAKFLKDKFFR